jgi:hypothetical protein
MYIQLTRGFITLVDDDLLNELNSYLWYASGLQGRPARRLIEPERRLICIYHQILKVEPWTLRKQGLVVDHINGDPLDNRRENIRIVTWADNARNADRHKNRRGIGYDSTHNRYKVYIDSPGEPRINICTCLTLVDAEIALSFAKMERGLADY